MATIAAVQVDLSANVARLSRDMAKANRTVGNSMKKMKKLVGGLGVALAGVVGTRALIRLGNDALDTADKMAKLSRSVGVGVEELSAYDHVAKLSGTDIQTVGRSLGLLSKNLLDASNGTGEAKDAFAALGIKATDANGNLRDSDEVLKEIADRFKVMRDGSEKAALSMRIFGRSGAALIPMLNAGSDGIADMQAEAKALGLTFDTNVAMASERINDNIVRMQGSFTGLSRNIVAGMLPTLENLSAMMIDTTRNEEAMAAASQTLAAGLKLIASAAVTVKALFNGIGKALGALAAAAFELASGNFANAWNIIKEGAHDVKAEVTETWDSLTQVWDDSAVKQAQSTVTQHQTIQTSYSETARIATEAAKAEAEAQREKARLLKEIASLTLDLADEETRLAAAAQARTEMVNSALEMEVVSAQRAADLKLQIQADYQTQLDAMRMESAEIQVQKEIETAERLAEVWLTRADSYIGFAQQMATMSGQYALADEEQQKNISQRMLATGIRFLSQSLAAYLFNKAKEKVFAAASAAAQIQASTSVATADMAIGAARASAWAAYYAAHAANPIGAGIYGASAAAMSAAIGGFGAAGGTAAGIGAAGVSSNLAAAAGFAAAGIGVTAIGEALASKAEGTLSGSGQGVYGEGSPTSPVITESVSEATTARVPIVNVHIHGNVVDHDQFARDLVPSIQKAVNDGMSL